MIKGEEVVFLNMFLEKKPGKGWTRTVEHNEWGDGLESDCVPSVGVHCT